MLAQPTKGIDEIFERLKGKAFTAEWKYDGERAQVSQFYKLLNNICRFTSLMMVP